MQGCFLGEAKGMEAKDERTRRQSMLGLFAFLDKRRLGTALLTAAGAAAAAAAAAAEMRAAPAAPAGR